MVRSSLQIGLDAQIADYTIMLVDGMVTISRRDDSRVARSQRVSNPGRFVQRAAALRFMQAVFADFEVLYIVDLTLDGYGCAINLRVPRLGG